MGGSASRDAIRKTGKVEIVLLGCRRVGKASLITSIHRAMTEDYSATPVAIGAACQEHEANRGRASTTLRRTAAGSDVVLFDWPLASWADQVAQLDQLPPTIDAVVLVLKGTNFELPSPDSTPGYLLDEDLPQSKRLLSSEDEWHSIAEKLRAVSTRPPVVVVTHSTEIVRHQRVLREFLTSCLAPGAIFFLDNYFVEDCTSDGRKDDTCLNIIAACQRPTTTSLPSAATQQQTQPSLHQ